MQRYKFSELTNDLLKNLVELEFDSRRDWQTSQTEITEAEAVQLKIIKERLQNEKVSRLNESTVWGRAVYPLLMLSERETVKTWADAPLSVQFATFTLEGIADGIISDDDGGNPKTPYLIIIEGKKGIDTKDLQPQLYGAMLAAAKLNFDENKREPQTIHGCYTIADTWTFMRGEVSAITDDKPVFKVQSSREFVERFEAEIILGVLKAIVATYYYKTTY